MKSLFLGITALCVLLTLYFGKASFDAFSEYRTPLIRTQGNVSGFASDFYYPNQKSKNIKRYRVWVEVAYRTRDGKALTSQALGGTRDYEAGLLEGIRLKYPIGSQVELVYLDPYPNRIDLDLSGTNIRTRPAFMVIYGVALLAFAFSSIMLAKNFKKITEPATVTPPEDSPENPYRVVYSSDGSGVTNIATYQEAVHFATEATYDSLLELYERNITPEQLLAKYVAEGCHPMIEPIDPADEPFDANLFAEQIVARVCEDAALNLAALDEKVALSTPRTEVEMRKEGMVLTDKSFLKGESAFIRDVCTLVLDLAKKVDPSFRVLDEAVAQGGIDWYASENEIMGYHDYSIYHRNGAILSPGDQSLQIKVSQSNGYDPSESCLTIRTLGLRDGAYIVAIAELETGHGYLLWKGLDITRWLG